MKQIIEIEVPDGKKAVWKDGKVIFENIKPQLPKTWEEFCKISNISEKEYYISNCERVIKVHRIRSYPVIRNPERDCAILPSKKAAKQHLALMQLHQLRDCYRQGWIPVLNDNIEMYTIKKSRNIMTHKLEITVLSASTLSSFLLFPTYELAEEFLTNFRELIEQAWDLI